MTERYRVEVADIDYWRKMICCQWACPVNTNAAGYVQAAAEQRWEDGYRMAKGPNPMASVCARCCNAPCEIACRRGAIDRPVAIRALKKALTLKHGVESPAFDWPKRRLPLGDKVAIIGSGPAGLVAGHDLALMGYAPTIFEMLPIPGGMISVGVPEYRLEREVLFKEIQEILDQGVELKLNVEVGIDVTIKELFEQGYKAALIATGFHRGRPLPIEGMDLEGVMDGIVMIRKICLGQQVSVGRRVAVIGGGNVAFDTSRSAVRFAPDEVQLFCLESWEEMPADDLEKEEGTEEGIVIHTRKGPARILGRGGRVAGLVTQDVLSVFDEQGRFAPKFVPDSFTVWDCDTVLVTIGQASDLTVLNGVEGVEVSPRGTLARPGDPLGIYTTAPGIFTAGDVATGPTVIIEMEASGRRAAEAIHQYLTGKKKQAIKKIAKFTRVHTDMRDFEEGTVRPFSQPWIYKKYDKIQRLLPPALPPDYRRHNREVTEQQYEDREAIEQGKRCLKCNINTIFDGTKCIMCNGCVDVCPEYAMKMVSLDQIEGDEKLREVIRLKTGRPLQEYHQAAETGVKAFILNEATVMLKDEDRCIRCSLCEKKCPTGAITMELFEYEQITVEA